MEQERELKVNYREELCALVKMGNYDWVEKGVYSIGLEPKKETKEEVLSVKLLPSKKKIEHGYRHATTTELAFFGITYPEIQMNARIVALGDLRKNDLVPCLESFSYRRWFNTRCLNELKGDYCYLCVKI